MQLPDDIQLLIFISCTNICLHLHIYKWHKYIYTAFDAVDHNILLSKLNHYRIRGLGFQWRESYLSNRKQFTYVNDNQSKLNSINYGVPQGSVLGPLIYTNDIINCTKEDVKQGYFQMMPIALSPLTHPAN